MIGGGQQATRGEHHALAMRVLQGCSST